MNKVIFFLSFFIPTIIFFIFNMLTPFWWDDYIMACFITEWHSPKTHLNSSFSDIITSIYNMYHAWHGRIIVNFINFLFMYLKDKTIFNIFNTIVYFLFIIMINYHVVGSFKKITGYLFIVTNILLWLLLSAWGQTFLWLTGSLNYLWTTAIILVFLVPFRKKIEDKNYKPSVIFSISWIFIGILAGCGMENSASGVFLLLFAYFVFKIYKKEKVVLFEILSFIGFVLGFFILINARNSLFPGLFGLFKNLLNVGISFIFNEIIVLTIIVLLIIELLCFRKKKIDLTTYGYIIIVLGSVAGMAFAGYYKGRATFITQIFLIMTLLSLFQQTKYIFNKRYLYACMIILFAFFIPSFYSGSKAISVSFLINESRERYIISEIKNGNNNIRAKTPILVRDSHCGLYGGFDILHRFSEYIEEYEYVAHNSAKAVWYGIESLDGIPISRSSSTSYSIKRFLSRRKHEDLKIDDLFAIIYEDW